MSMSAVEARFQPGSKWLWKGREVTVVKLSHSREFVHVDTGAAWPSAVAPRYRPGRQVCLIRSIPMA